MLEYLKPAIQWLHFHPIFACAATFLIAFAESIAIIGLVIPGSVLFIGIGTLIGSGVISPSATIISAIIGAVAGDFLSFWVGFHYRDHIHSIWPFRRWPKLLKKGEKFFLQHGGKGVFLGRFIGPMRPITPVVAGVMKMPLVRFALVDIASAILWAIAYMLPGIVLGGAASAELSSEAVPHFILIILIAIVTIALLYWVIAKIIMFFVNIYLHFEAKLWNKIERSSHFPLLKRLVYTPYIAERVHQIDLLFLLITSIILFFVIAYQVMTHGILLHYNDAVYFFFRSLRTDVVDKVMIPITFLGEKRPMMVLVLAVGAILFIKRYFRAAAFWLANGALIFGLAGITKIALHIHRPFGTKGALAHGWSFPSGHTSLSIAILGFLALLLAQELPRLARKYIYWFTVCLVCIIALSRLYLGAHWLSDVLGGFFLGLASMSLITLIYRHQKTHLKARKTIVLVALVFWLGAWGILLAKEYNLAFDQYQLSWPRESITVNEWEQQNGENSAPLYRHDRFGKPVQTINIQLLGNLNTVAANLQQQGWSVLNENALKLLFYRLSDQHDAAKLPFLTQQYLGKAPLIALYKTVGSDHLLILRFWNSGIQILPNQKTLIAGAVNYHHAWHPRILHKPNMISDETPAEPALQAVADDLKASGIKLKMTHFEQYPPLNDTTDEDWNGLVLLIKTR